MVYSETYNKEELLQLIANGDEPAFARFYHHFKNKVYSVAYTYTEDVALSEEIVQDVFVSVWKNRVTLPAIQNVDAWLYTIARNYSLNGLQQMARLGRENQRLLSHLPVQAVEPVDKAHAAELKVLLQEAINKLSPQQKKIFELSRMQGLKREDIARELNLSVVTVSSHLTIAIKTVRAYLANRIDLTILLILLGYSI